MIGDGKDEEHHQKAVPERARHVRRIRSGIAQSDTSLTTELNLAMALQNDERVDGVDFVAVWGQGHTQAERMGSATDNFVSWVRECMAS